MIKFSTRVGASENGLQKGKWTFDTNEGVRTHFMCTN